MAKVAYGNVPVRVSALGTVTPLVTAVVHSQQSGNLVRIDFVEGQRVHKGQQLALVDPRPFALAQAQSAANLARDEALLANARIDLQRYETLLKEDSIARQTTRDPAPAGQAVRRARSLPTAPRSAAARLNLAYTSVKSPVDGRIGLRQTDIGNYVTPGRRQRHRDGHPDRSDRRGILAAAGAARRISSSASDRAAAACRSPRPTRAAPRRSPQGKLLTFDNTIDTTTGTVKAKARFAEPGNWRLLPNQFVNVSMLVDTLHHVMIVPVSAVRHGAPGDFVFVAQRRSHGEAEGGQDRAERRAEHRDPVGPFG